MPCTTSRTFTGQTRADRTVYDHAHESPLVMMVPLYLLAAGAVLSGFAFHHVFIGEGYEAFWKGSLFTGKENHILHDMHGVPTWVVWSPFVMMVAGFALAVLFYVLKPELPAKLAQRHRAPYLFLLNKWYFDELYDFIFVRPAKWLGRLFWKSGDGRIIDGFGPDGVASTVLQVTGRVVKLQTGYVYNYAFAMLIGVAALVSWYLFGGLR